MQKKENTKELPKTRLEKIIQGFINLFSFNKKEVTENGQKELTNVSSKEDVIEDCQRKLIDIQEKLETLEGSDLEKYRLKASARLNMIKEVSTKLNHIELLKKVDDTQNMLCFQYHSPS